MSTKNTNKILNRINNKLKIRGNNKSGDQYDMFWPQFLLFASQHEFISVSSIQKKFKNIPNDRVTKMCQRLVQVKWAKSEPNGQYLILFSLSELKTISVQGWSFTCRTTDMPSTLPKTSVNKLTESVVSSASKPVSNVSTSLLHSVSSFPESSIDHEEQSPTETTLSKMDYVNQYYEIVPHFESDLVWDLVYDQVNEYTTVYDIKAKANHDYVITNIDRQTAQQILDLLYFQYVKMER